MMPEKKEQKKRCSTVPWKDPKEWGQVLASIKRIDDLHHEKLGRIREMAKNIHSNYQQLEQPIEDTCSLTCTACKAVCCVRATIWFDFKDLLYLYFGTDSFPREQICKASTANRSACVHLTKKGCSLSRERRPFVCTWYFCPDQKKYLSDQENTRQLCMNDVLTQIKVLRNEIEEAFVQVASE